ncbi:MAG: glycosyltransferase [Candidatus Micrarchaeota archaeon]|nr:glycosyltransferase [Candidatus Micrarchaeota archaeon]
MPLISIVIPTLNEEKYLLNVFRGLKQQSFRDFEVIVSDKESTDRTRQIAKKNGAKVVVVKKAGIGAGRNAGAKIARGKILVFIDADTRPSSDLLKVYSKAFKDPKIIAATGPIFALEKTDELTKLGYAFVSEIFVKVSIVFGRASIIGSNFAVRKSIFDKVRGFDEHLITYEDYDLSLRIAKYGEIAFLQGASVSASVRRVAAWGILKYFTYHFGNMVRYKFFRKSKDDYAPIR